MKRPQSKGKYGGSYVWKRNSYVLMCFARYLELPFTAKVILQTPLIACRPLKVATHTIYNRLPLLTLDNSDS